jgi:tRNA(fMet)-specific endonuclease VapC
MLDTDTCIAIIKKHPVALKKLRGKSIGQLGLSSTTLGELAFGADKSSRPRDAIGHRTLIIKCRYLEC